MIIPEFKSPGWLNNQDAETIHKRMMDMLPTDIDDTEGGFPWDLTKPTALEKAEILEFYLVETLKIMFPAWADGEWLDLHAKERGLTRKSANKATGVLRVTGIPGTVIPAGFRFATHAIDNKASIEYEAIGRYIVETSGMVDVQISAVEAGTIGNVPSGTISLMMTPINGIVSIANIDPVTGGTAEESDDALRIRLAELDASEGASFVGSDSDYIKWAKEIPGVGSALVIPEWNGPGTVKVIIIDANGQPANTTIVNAVFNNIMSPTDRINRKAPIGATVTVEAPLAKTLNYSFTLEIHLGETQGTVLERFTAHLQNYYIEAKRDGVVRYNRIVAILSQTIGVKDFTGLTINGATANIVIAADEYPVTGIINPAGGGV